MTDYRRLMDMAAGKAHPKMKNPRFDSKCPMCCKALNDLEKRIAASE